MLVPDGARDATARIRSIVSRGTGVGRKARTERREVIAASVAAVSEGVGVVIGPDCHGAARKASVARSATPGAPRAGRHAVKVPH